MVKYYNTSEHRNLLSRRAAPYLLCVLVLFYLAFHTISGERGIIALFRETGKLEALKAELAEVKKQKEAMENKINKLSNKNLDLDLLDEQAKKILGVAGKNEVVIFLDKKD